MTFAADQCPQVACGMKTDAFGSVAGAKRASGPNQKLIGALGPTLKGITNEMAALNFA